MTEQQWLTSHDPAFMLQGLGVPSRHGSEVQKVSDYKLRMFVEACRQAFEPETEWSLWSPAIQVQAASTWWVNELAPGGKKEKAHFLRCIVGNPFRPLPALRQSGGSVGGQGLEDLDWTSPWLTPTVLTLAQAAYSERSRVWQGRQHDHEEYSGWVEEGTLDPHRLLVLADALEQAGCCGEREWLCGAPDPQAGLHSHEGRAGQVIHGVLHETDPRRPHHHHDEKCPRADRPHPLLAHLRSPGPHVRGCWAVALILGKG